MQGKLFQRCTHLLYCSVLSPGGNVNTRRMSKSDMGSIFHIKNKWNILATRNYYVNYENYQNSNYPWILNEHWCLYSCLQIPPRENWFQYLRSVYATAIKFPCIISLSAIMSEHVKRMTNYIFQNFKQGKWSFLVRHIVYWRISN